MATKCVVNKSTMTGIANAIRAKGGTSDTLLPSEMPAAIQAIPSGDPYYNEQWNPQPWMPNLRKILAEDTETGYAHKFAVLLCGYDGETTFSKPSDANAMRCGNGVVVTGASIELTDPTVHESTPFYYVVIYTNNDVISNINDVRLVWLCSTDDALSISLVYPYNTRKKLKCLEGNFTNDRGYNYGFQGAGSLEAIIGHLDFSKCTDFARTFGSCYSLKSLPDDTTFGAGNGNISELFYGCESLKKIYVTDFSQMTNLGMFARGCSSILSPIDLYAPNATSASEALRGLTMYKIATRIFIPNVVSLSQYMFYGSVARFLCDEFVATGLTSDINTNVFNYLGSYVWALPKKFQINKSFTMASLTGLKAEYKDSFAKFEEGVLVADCFASNLYDATGLGLTATMPSVLKSFYSDAEQAAIEAAFNAKGWTLAW